MKIVFGKTYQFIHISTGAKNLAHAVFPNPNKASAFPYAFYNGNGHLCICKAEELHPLRDARGRFKKA